MTAPEPFFKKMPFILLAAVLLLGLPSFLYVALTQHKSQAPAPAPLRTPYQAIARGKIDVEGGLITVTAARDGVLSDILVQAGDTVRRGQALARLDSRSARIAISLAEAEQQQAEAQLKLLGARLPGQQQTAQRWQAAAAAGVAEQQQADDANQALQQLNAEISVATAAREVARQKVLQARQELALLTIEAPVDADIVRVLAQPGSTLSTQERTPVLTLLPHTPLLVRAEVNESFIANLHPGMKAEVSLEALPGQPALAAVVTRISPVLENGRLGDEPQTSRVVECLLQFSTPPTISLHLGQNVLVKFHD